MIASRFFTNSTLARTVVPSSNYLPIKTKTPSISQNTTTISSGVGIRVLSQPSASKTNFTKMEVTETETMATTTILTINDIGMDHCEMKVEFLKNEKKEKLFDCQGNVLQEEITTESLSVTTPMTPKALHHQ